MSRILKVNWSETAADLKQQYRSEKHHQRRERLLSLWHLREGKSIKSVAALTGSGERRIRQWVSWYREGGLSEVMKRVTGHGTTGVSPYLSHQRQKALVARVQLGDFGTVWEVIKWVEDRWGINYSYEGMRSVMKRNQLNLKVPRPQSEKADPQRQADWQKKS